MQLGDSIYHMSWWGAHASWEKLLHVLCCQQDFI